MKQKIILIIFLLYTFSLYAASKEINKLIVQGEKYYKSKNYSKAKNTFLQVLEKDPKNIRVLGNMTITELKLDNLKSAEKYANSVIEFAEKDSIKASAYYNLGLVKEKQELIDDAIKLFIKKLSGINLNNFLFSLQMEGDFSKDNIQADGEIVDITANYNVYPRNMICSLKMGNDFNKLNLNIHDNNKSLIFNLKKNYSHIDIKTKFNKFPISDYKLVGDMNYKQMNKKFEYAVFVKSKQKRKLFVNLLNMV